MSQVLRVFKAEKQPDKDKISLQSINDSRSRMSVMGMRMPDTEPKMKLPVKVQKAIANGQIDEKEYIAMLTYAKYLPRGKRMLKLNYPELRDMLIGVQEKGAPLTKTTGLNSGGKLSKDMPVKKLREMSQKQHLVTIKNENRVRSMRNATADKKAPNPSSWKNLVELRKFPAA